MTEMPTPKISEILEEEFMAPLQISACFLAKQIGVPTSRIQDLLHDRRQITADTSLRLGRFFGVSDQYFLAIQNDIEIRKLKQRNSAAYAQIKPYQVN
ncbi:addiction module antidote protein, HigA family [Lactiplantibacillus pentosus]|uniref:Putative plantaricin biosynthesis protein PlnY ((PlnY)) n=1 Tax=Lactiplantibacillus pentosus IG1 TaxID=1042160 RepID=G0M3J4_LACPE|nr:HigA family addiction module antitoxin [Lactiplantibacillus pentosus]CCC16697.1 putative plantaricin biosynthesis protein PlnY ((PlnY) [Lactiplantibacillus pentosus IG1]MCT3282203.1 addiction module antidote protein, HigA family [Lactiplantibacillus pentosus]MCT3302489.1 addiction module antidote protein, HigA family [Lactiplantibacillus pentosus]PRO80900.1 addiction module antidote protein, HigA family [Lactiplantibacillus pentosus]PRO81568.1 addiction module antidote protein, HigA family 